MTSAKHEHECTVCKALWDCRSPRCRGVGDPLPCFSCEPRAQARTDIDMWNDQGDTMKPTVLDLLKAVLWLENRELNDLPDELYMRIRDYVAEEMKAPDKGRVYFLGKPIFESLEFKEPPPEHRTPSLTCVCGGTMRCYWRPNGTRGISCDRCGAGGKPLMQNAANGTAPRGDA